MTVGGTGVGRTDAAVTALATRGKVLAHGIALQPGRTAAVGRIGKTPVVVLPGAPDQALAAWWTLALPVLDRLSGRRPRKTLTLPLARKIASGVGIAEIVLLERKQGIVDRRWRWANCRSRRSPAPMPGWWCPAARKDLRRARRSMPICCGTDMSSDMTNTLRAERS